MAARLPPETEEILHQIHLVETKMKSQLESLWELRRAVLSRHLLKDGPMLEWDYRDALRSLERAASKIIQDGEKGGVT